MLAGGSIALLGGNDKPAAVRPKQPTGISSTLRVIDKPRVDATDRISAKLKQTALAKLARARTLAQAQQALQQFGDYYFLKMQVIQVNPSLYVRRYDSFNQLKAADLPKLKAYGTIFIEEWSKYPEDWVVNSGIKTVALVKDFAVQKTHRAAGPDPTDDVMYYDIGYGTGDYAREVIHHEYDHLIEYTYFGTYSSPDPAWKSFNPPGFHYGKGGASCYNPRTSQCYVGPHVLTGFASGYAASAIEEDKAEAYGYLMTSDYYHQLKVWIKTDHYLAKKVTAYKRFMASHSTHMSGNYFDVINR